MRKESLLVGGGALAALAGPTTANAALSYCNSNYICVWGNNDYKWLIAEQYHGQGSWLDPFTAEEDDPCPPIDTGHESQAAIRLRSRDRQRRR